MLIEWCGKYQINHNPVLANFADIIGLDVSVDEPATVQVQVVSARLCKKALLLCVHVLQRLCHVLHNRLHNVETSSSDLLITYLIA